MRFSLDLHDRLGQQSPESSLAIRDRIGIHMGEVFVQERGEATKLFGIHVDTAARVMSLAAGGQILMSRLAFDTSRQALRRSALRWLNHGAYSLKGLDEPIEICEVRAGEEAEPVVPPPSSDKAQRVSADGELVLGWRPALDQQIPNTRWILTDNLGEGGFGEVWLARHEKLKEQRVFKFCFKADRVRALKREMTLFRILKEHIGDHPNIVRIYAVYLDDPPYYLEMEYVDGSNLRRWFESQAGLSQIPESAKLEIIAQIADALHAAHTSGILHRDIKRGNILISNVRRSRRQEALIFSGRWAPNW